MKPWGLLSTRLVLPGASVANTLAKWRLPHFLSLSFTLFSVLGDTGRAKMSWSGSKTGWFGSFEQSQSHHHTAPNSPSCTGWVLVWMALVPASLPSAPPPPRLAGGGQDWGDGIRNWTRIYNKRQNQTTVDGTVRYRTERRRPAPMVGKEAGDAWACSRGLRKRRKCASWFLLGGVGSPRSDIFFFFFKCKFICETVFFLLQSSLLKLPEWNAGQSGEPLRLQGATQRVCA